MARVGAILRALATVSRRTGRSFGAFYGNNLFAVSLLLLFGKDPGAFAALNSVILLVLFLPLSGDPLHRIPADRMALWPLANAERRQLRVLSLGLNPVAWVVVGLAVWNRLTLGLWGLIAGLFAVGLLMPWLPAARGGMWRWVPSMPGRLGQLVRKDLREALCMLDFYAALLMSAVTAAYRAAGILPADALLPMTLLVLIAFSTQSQTLFGLDGPGGMTRYRLMPVEGWKLLAAKDAGYLILAVLLTLPLAPLAGLGGALASLAVGHWESVRKRRDGARWRFSTGASFGGSMLAVLALILAGAETQRVGWPVLLLCVALYAASTGYYGRELETVE